MSRYAVRWHWIFYQMIIIMKQLRPQKVWCDLSGYGFLLTSYKREKGEKDGGSKDSVPACFLQDEEVRTSYTRRKQLFSPILSSRHMRSNLCQWVWSANEFLCICDDERITRSWWTINLRCQWYLYAYQPQLSRGFPSVKAGVYDFFDGSRIRPRKYGVYRNFCGPYRDPTTEWDIFKGRYSPTRRSSGKPIRRMSIIVF